MIGEVKYLQTEFAKWRIERVAGESGGRRWAVGWWVADEDGNEHLVELGRWVTWKAAIEAIIAKEAYWHQRKLERLERSGVKEGG